MSQITQLKSLDEIAEIRSGFTFREKVEEVSEEQGNAHIAQIKDVRSVWECTNSFFLQANALPLIRWEGKDQAFVAPGTVLLPSRGGYFKAFYLASNNAADLPVVASSQFLLFKPKQEVLPDFLCWALNQPDVQKKFMGFSQGTSIPMLSLSGVKQLKLNIPPLAIQRKIVSLNQLWEQEQSLTKALLKNRETMLQGLFQQWIQGGKV